MWNEPRTMALARERTHWWSYWLTMSVTQFLCHSAGHQQSICVVYRQGMSSEWTLAKETMAKRNVEKIICLEHVGGNHYAVTVLRIRERTIHNLDGLYNLERTQCRLAAIPTSEWGALIQDLFEQLNQPREQLLGPPSEYTLVKDWYQRQGQRDGWNCAPIAVLTIYKEYTGQALLGEVEGALFYSQLRQRLLDCFDAAFQNLYNSGHLRNSGHGTLRRGGRGLSWHPPTLPSSPIRHPDVTAVRIATATTSPVFLKRNCRRQSNVEPTTAATPRSIAATAREAPKVTESRKRQKGNFYDLRYHQNRVGSCQRQSHDPSQLLSGRAVPTPSMKDQRTTNDNFRNCYCDVYCEECTNTNKACSPAHDGLFCSGSCNRWFHAECAGLTINEDNNGTKYLTSTVDAQIRIPLNEHSQGANPWYCVKCTPMTSKSVTNLREKAFCLGFDEDSWVGRNGKPLTARSKQSRVATGLGHLQAILPNNLIEPLMSTPPNSFPTLKPLHPEDAQKMSLAGRRFEIAQLQLRVQSCSCCGVTKPFYDDPFAAYDSVNERFHRSHLSDSYHLARHCRCEGFCKGSQFFTSRSQNVYNEEHPGGEFDFDTLPEEPVCKQCHKDCAGPQATALAVCRVFSTRNGFGPIPRPVPNTQHFELTALLASLTPGEEAAIRQVTPLVSIMRLKHGNIGSKGTTTCVWQQSKINAILPNLPHECRIITIQRRKQREGVHISLKSYEFQREKIVRALTWLKDTRAVPWNEIEISEEAISQWPETGNLASLAVSIPEAEEDNDSDNHSNDDGVREDEGEARNLVADGGDRGPAPLQNAMEPDETFVGTCPTSLRTDNISDANRALQEFDTTVQLLRGVTIERDRATMQQESVLPTGGFVDMRNTRYSWARAFPSVFHPVPNADGSWVVPGDITGHHVNVKERQVSWTDWCKWLMWRSDGLPARHPTLPLVLHSETVRSQLFTQGSVCISLNDTLIGDPTMNVTELADKIREDPNYGKSIATSINYFAGNVRGTDQYFASVQRDFRAVAFFNNYINNQPIRLFHTASMAEYHDPNLRRIISTYTASVESEESGKAVLDDDAVFADRMRAYGHVVTNFFAFKFECWLYHFLGPVYGIHDLAARFEFAKSRGAIHAHCIASATGVPYEKLDAALAQACLDVDSAVSNLEHCIRERLNEHYPVDTKLASTLFSSDYRKCSNKRREFLGQDSNGKMILEEFDKTKEAILEKCGMAVEGIMETHFGNTAMHIGAAPSEWLLPGGTPHSGYRQTSAAMQSKSDVLSKKELQKHKFERENDLYDRRVNATNHCFTHSCSNYCWRTQHFEVVYNPEKHVPGKDGCMAVYDTSSGRKAKIAVQTCRMGFGNKLKFPLNRDYTGGAAPVMKGGVVVDPNGQLKFNAQRNHPRVVQEPVGMFHWGANADMQIMLVNNQSFEVASNEGRDYPELIKHLHLANLSGLEQFSASHTCMEYTAGYSCKGAKNSEEWNKTFAACLDGVSSKSSDASLRKLFSTFMYTVANSRDVPRDEAMFTLSGGNYTYNTRRVKSCSLNRVSLQELGGESEGVEPDSRSSRFNLRNILQKYRSREVQRESENLFQCTAREFKCVPNFYGYNDKPSWPLDEDFSRAMLFLYHPHRGTTDHLRVDGSYSKALEVFMANPQFPKQIYVEISRMRSKWRFEQSSQADQLAGEEADSFTATSHERTNEALANAAEAADAHEGDNDVGGLRDAELGDSQFSELETGFEDHEWTTPPDNDSPQTYAREIRQSYIESDAEMMERDDEQRLLLFDEQVYRPENAQGKAQHMLMALTLYYLQNWLLYEEAAKSPDPLPPPPSVRLYVPGEPGTGKSFSIRTMSNIARVVFKSNRASKTAAPTGCAASLVGGSTNARCFKIPIGRQSRQYVTDKISGPATIVKSTTKGLYSTKLMTLDESSMLPRHEFAWIENRCSTACRSPEARIAPEVSERSFGGIPIVAMFGDCHQLPPVCAKSHFDDSKPVGDANAADALGRQVFRNFLNPPNDREVSIVIVMDKTLRQTDEHFKASIQQMRYGNVSRSSAELLVSRCSDTISDEERKFFEEEALYILPTWKETVPITIQYLKGLKPPIARIDAKFNVNRGVNHCLKEINMPVRSALALGAKVMLLTNYVVEWGTYNGTVGTVIDIVYETPEGPRVKDAQPVYVVVDMPDISFPPELVWNREHPTWFPVPLETMRCERNCCSMTTIPLRVCKAITIIKSQGQSVGPGNNWTKLVCRLPQRSTPGLELVAISRVTDPSCLMILPENLTIDRLLRIGQSPAYQPRRDFEEKCREQAVQSETQLEALIASMDVNLDHATFEGGYQVLVSWYRALVDNLGPSLLGGP